MLQRQLHLEWIYRNETPVRTGRCVQLDAADCCRRFASMLDDLWQLGQIGHVRGIQSRLRDCEAQEPQALPLVRAAADNGGEIRHEALHDNDQGDT